VLGETDEEPSPTREPILEWSPRPLRDFAARLYREEGRYAFWTNHEGWFNVDPQQRSIAVSNGVDPVRRESRLWGVPALLCYVAHGRLPLHASAVDVGGRAVIFPAPGRSGKTTTAASFHRAGHRVLGEDLIACEMDGAPAVFPGPAMLRLRRDIHERLEIPRASVVGEDHDRLYLAIDPEARGDGTPVPLAAIVFLRRGPGPPTIERRNPQAVVQDLWQLSLSLPDEADRARSFRGVSTLAATVPAWDLERDLTLTGLDAVIDLVLATCL
jgi:hypothetical protein